MPNSTPIGRIQEFLSQRRLAVAGVSTNPRDFSRALFREFLERGYEAVAVNPDAHTDVDGAPAFHSVTDVHPPVTAALLMTPPPVTEVVVRQCAEAGIRHIWMYRAVGRGAVSEEAVSFCESHGMSVIAGECPYMFLPGAMWIHRLHGVIRQAAGSYPR